MKRNFNFLNSCFKIKVVYKMNLTTQHFSERVNLNLKIYSEQSLGVRYF